MAWMTVPRHPRSQLHAYFHVLGLEMVSYSNVNVVQCLYIAFTLCGWPQFSTIQDWWGESSEWVKWHGWQYQAIQDRVLSGWNGMDDISRDLPNRRIVINWNRKNIQTYYTDSTNKIITQSTASNISPGQKVKLHLPWRTIVWHFHKIFHPCAMNWRVLSGWKGGRFLSGWNGLDDSTKPTKIPITCLIPRFGAGSGAV
jgi:hypothetical protein